MIDPAKTTLLIAACFSSACVQNPAPLGQAETDSETGRETEGDPEPFACESPCVIVQAHSNEFLFHWELWAIELGSPPSAPQRLFAPDASDSKVMGRTPWGSLAVYYDLPDDERLGFIAQVRTDDDDVLAVTPLLSTELPAEPQTMQFDDSGTVAVIEVFSASLVGSSQLWGVRIADEMGVEPTLLSPNQVEGASIQDWMLLPDGSGVVFQHDREGNDLLYWTPLQPDFGLPAPMTAATDDLRDARLAGDRIVAILSADVYTHRIETWSQADPLGPSTVLAADVTDQYLYPRGKRLYYTPEGSSPMIADVESGEAAPLEVVDVHTLEWLRDDVLLVSSGVSSGLSMVELDGVQPGPLIPVTGELPPGTIVDSHGCDGAAQYCLYSTVSDDTRQIALVDISGDLVGEPITLFKELPLHPPPAFYFLASTHAVLFNIDDDEVVVVDLATAEVAKFKPPLPSGAAAEFMGVYPHHDVVLLVVDDPETSTSTLWRGSMAGDDFEPIVHEHVWLDSEGWWFNRPVYPLD